MPNQCEYLSLKDVARVLGLKSYRISHALAVGAVPEPAIHVANRRIFQGEDLQRLARHFGVKGSVREPAVDGMEVGV